MRRAALATVLTLAVVLVLGLHPAVEVTHEHVHTGTLPEGHTVRLALLTDTHSSRYGDDQQEIRDLVAAEHPDVILLGGDIIDDVLPRRRGLDTVAHLAQVAPTFYVTGNHEIWTEEDQQIKAALRDRGITVLEGTTAQVQVRGVPVTIAGLDDPDVGWQVYDAQRKALAEALGGETQGSETQGGEARGEDRGPVLLLAHRPDRVGDYRDIGADVILSGHAHGGQWRLPWVLDQGLYAPSQGLFPQHTSGIVDTPSGTLVISRGLSRDAPKVPRLYNRPEIVILEVS